MKITAHVNFSEAEESTHVIATFQSESKRDPTPESTHDEFSELLQKLAAEDVFKGKKAACISCAPAMRPPQIIFS